MRKNTTPLRLEGSTKNHAFSGLFSFILLATLATSFAQGIPDRAERSELATYFLSPTRIVWTSGEGVKHPDTLLQPGMGQATLKPEHPPTALAPGSGAIVLDFGIQLSGYLELFTPGSG